MVMKKKMIRKFLFKAKEILSIFCWLVLTRDCRQVMKEILGNDKMKLFGIIIMKRVRTIMLINKVLIIKIFRYIFCSSVIVISLELK